MASRRRRRKNIGGVIAQTEARVRRVEKRPGATRLKTNVVSTEKIQPRAVVTKVIATDAVTANEAAFGVTVVTDTQPTEYLKEGTTWVDPNTGSTQVWSTDSSTFIEVTDSTARASADGKNTIYRQTSQPTGGTYVTGDVWFDSDDNNKIYRYNGTSWVAVQLGGNGLANINANSITTGTIDASVITVSNLDAGNITTGSLSATRIGAGTISASIEMTSATVTGGLIRTSATGERIEVTNGDEINFYNSSGTLSARISPYTEAGYDSGLLVGDGTGAFATGLYVASDLVNLGVDSSASISFIPSIGGTVYSSSTVMTIESDILSITGISSVQVTSDTIVLDVGTNFVQLDSIGDFTMDTSSANNTYGLRNIRAVSSFTAGSDTSGGIGDVVLVYTP